MWIAERSRQFRNHCNKSDVQPVTWYHFCLPRFRERLWNVSARITVPSVLLNGNSYLLIAIDVFFHGLAYVAFDTDLIICHAAAISIQITAGPWGLVECYHVTCLLFQPEWRWRAPVSAWIACNHMHIDKIRESVQSSIYNVIVVEQLLAAVQVSGLDNVLTVHLKYSVLNTSRVYIS